jgi:hypothetical protein
MKHDGKLSPDAAILESNRSELHNHSTTRGKKTP